MRALRQVAGPLLLWFVMLAAPALAQDDVATVRLDGQSVFQVGPATDDDDAAARARRIEVRLATSTRSLRPLHVRARRAGSSTCRAFPSSPSPPAMRRTI